MGIHREKIKDATLVITVIFYHFKMIYAWVRDRLIIKAITHYCHIRYYFNAITTSNCDNVYSKS